MSSNRVQQLSQSVCIGVTLSFGWLGKLSREAANRVRFEPRATFELRATSVPGIRAACDIQAACDIRDACDTFQVPLVPDVPGT